MPEPPMIPSTALVIASRSPSPCVHGACAFAAPQARFAILTLRVSLQLAPRNPDGGPARHDMSNYGVLDTRFRSALDRMAAQGRLQAYTAPIDPHLEVAAVMKAL